LDRQSSWGQYWNYLRRQLFVLDTYFSSSSRLLNHGMMLLHSWASAAFAVAGLMILMSLSHIFLIAFITVALTITVDLSLITSSTMSPAMSKDDVTGPCP
ncbi:uncharacterized protein HaLaN_32037, partial [Haematococcus lacustris]